MASRSFVCSLLSSRLLNPHKASLLVETPPGDFFHQRRDLRIAFPPLTEEGGSKFHLAPNRVTLFMTCSMIGISGVQSDGGHAQTLQKEGKKKADMDVTIINDFTVPSWRARALMPSSHPISFLILFCHTL